LWIQAPDDGSRIDETGVRKEVEYVDKIKVKLFLSTP
jgi:hypothetical protein